MPEKKAYFFEGRRTAVIASSASEARKNKRRGGDKIVSVQKLTPTAKKQVAKGKWTNQRPPGFKESMRGQGPKPKKAK